MSRDVKQIKTMTGEELICEVLQVYDDENSECMIIKNALSIICDEDRKREIRWYTFRPFMLHQDADQELVLNTANVLCITNPARGVLDYFHTYIQNFRQIKMETDDYIASRGPQGDSDLDNLIRFPRDVNKDKLH